LKYALSAGMAEIAEASFAESAFFLPSLFDLKISGTQDDKNTAWAEPPYEKFARL
jgi:hypothetical protein